MGGGSRGLRGLLGEWGFCGGHPSCFLDLAGTLNLLGGGGTFGGLGISVVGRQGWLGVLRLCHTLFLLERVVGHWLLIIKRLIE